MMKLINVLCSLEITTKHLNCIPNKIMYYKYYLLGLPVDYDFEVKLGMAFIFIQSVNLAISQTSDCALVYVGR